MSLGEWINNVLAGKTLYRVYAAPRYKVKFWYYTQKWTWCFPFWVNLEGSFGSEEDAEEYIRRRLHYFERVE